MRNVKYIIINVSQHKAGSYKHNARHDRNLGYHYVINDAKVVLHPIDIRLPGAFYHTPQRGQEDLNLCSIGILYNGTLSDSAMKATLIDLLVDLRFQFPEAKILGISEYDPHLIKVSDEMNQLRLELSDQP